ncbi:MAG: DHH family phosphoesterase [Planctomycetota bacterium]|nr:DHH family phosphoesterase [Planctomycetota bacterium]
MSGLNLRDFAKAFPTEGRVVLCTHRHPDPDGLGALTGVQFLLQQRFGLASDFVLEGRIRRAENAAMRDLLGIHGLPKGSVDPADYCGVVLVDSQPGFSHTHPPGGIPILAVIDHHRGPKEDGGLAVAPVFSWVDDSYGATSTMVHDLLRAFEVEPDERVATALFCGVRYDTNNLMRGAGPKDEEAFRWLEQRANRRIIAEIDDPPLPRSWFQMMHQALTTCRTHGPLALTLLGDVANPETVAEVADWLLRLEGRTWSLAGGACDGLYQVSLRTDATGADAYPAMRAILGDEGSCGGHGRMAGGQVPLDGRTVDEVRRILRERAVQHFGLEGEAEEAVVPVWEPGARTVAR